MEWRCAGLGWPEGRPVLRWAGGRVSSLAYGQAVGFRAVGERRCVGARGNACPLRAVVPGRATQARCPECARLDRAFSVAADGVPDDPRTYRVYLAWFGPGTVKVGITAEERGSVRLLEQGAVAFCWLGRGPLMAARRTEELLRAALGVPDRVPYARKRAVRAALPEWGERARELEELYGRAVALEGWAESLERLDFAAVDHAPAFGLAALGGETTGVVRELVAGGSVGGRLVAAAGPDLHLAVPGGAGASTLLVVDTRVLVGWELVKADVTDGVTVPVVAAGGDGGGAAGGAEQVGLF
ncbi:DUF2797 domain-containing protein [Streptomyces sp. NRRL S-1521]|uniref:DUF2797 domain-containing protein n=1 Tax=Streptomyces sp. NRRL S-1521 TaxID=1609100 RepID=UPI00074992AF|nr:DUF2797 domain-containing protein [Streptomyces sp. NRRL S-1521]KUL50051.1 hypothetical protein ADL30_30935 [Streptomyces sp. NRRL S-1521]